MIKPKLLFIIGMQKSGTSLCNRMLMKQPFITNPFLPEGASFWGDLPPFTPMESPCGQLYQKHNGLKGHALDSDDFNKKDNELLHHRIKNAKVKTPILMNKNPYNSVRTEWLKKHFPEAKIYAIVRNPIANIYSLLKKYDDRNNQGIGPENGWWGIKPRLWGKLINNNKVIQCTQQWNAVNQNIIDSQTHIDRILDYELICEKPNEIVKIVTEEFNLNTSIAELPRCKSFNDEYLYGSRLVSKNQELRRTGHFNLSELEEDIEFPPLTPSEIEYINRHSQDLWVQLKSKCMQL